MAGILVGLCLAAVIGLYFYRNPMEHSKRFMVRRFWNWFPLGMSYAFLYMARYNLTVSKNALGDLLPAKAFGTIFASGTIVYGFSLLLNGPLVDKIGGKKGILIATIGASIANIMMGIVTYLFLHHQLNMNLTLAFSILYATNMFFQSYGAVSIIKVKAYWFHVRERAIFGAIFGTLISFGVYFAFDWGGAIVDATKKIPMAHPSFFQGLIRSVFAVDLGETDATWLVFFIPAFILLFWALADVILLKDTPAQANFEDFDPHDASSDEAPGTSYTIIALIKRFFSNPILLTVAAVEFTSGVLRDGTATWYSVFSHQVPQAGAEFFLGNWGLTTCMAGIVGGFTGSFLSDKFFNSRRGPPVAILCSVMAMATVGMIFSVYSHPLLLGCCAVLIFASVIGVHSLMSGTAAADFGGRKQTATSSGLVDACVYLGSGLQAFTLGRLIPDHVLSTASQSLSGAFSGGESKSWLYWPIFLLPFTVMGFYFAYRIWHSLPAATKRYMDNLKREQAAGLTSAGLGVGHGTGHGAGAGGPAGAHRGFKTATSAE